MRLSSATLAMAMALTLTSTTAFLPPPAPMWSFNTFLASTKLGRYPSEEVPGYVGLGPCPDFSGRCVVDFARFPRSVKDVGVQLPAPFNSLLTVGDVIPTGQLWVWYTECLDVEVGSVQVPFHKPSATRHVVTVLATAVKLGCKTRVEVVNIPVPGMGFSLFGIGATLELQKPLQTTGTLVNLTLGFDSPSTSQVPNRVDLVSCAVHADIKPRVSDIRTIIPFADSTMGPVNWLLALAEPFFGAVLCLAMQQLISVTKLGTPGLVQALVTSLFNATANLPTLPDPDPVLVESTAVAALSGSPASGQAFSYNNDAIFVKAVTETLPSFLNGGHALNHVLMEITRSSGTLLLDGLRALGLSLRVPLPPLNVDLALDALNVSGLSNTSVNLVELFKPVATTGFSLYHRLVMDPVHVSVLGELVLAKHFAPSGWIDPVATANTATWSLPFDLGFSLGALDLSLTTLVIPAPDTFLSLQVGQLLGKSLGYSTPFGQLVAAGICVAPSLYEFQLSFLKLVLPHIDVAVHLRTPVEDVGVSTVVSQVVALALDMGQPLILAMPFVSQHWARPVLNQVLKVALVAGESMPECPPFVPSLSSPHVLNLTRSSTLRVAQQLIESFVGGYPVKQGTMLSINSLIPLVIDFVVGVFDLPATKTGGGYQFQPDVRLSGGKSAPPTKLQTTHVLLGGFSSVTRLEVFPTNATRLSIRLDLGGGNSAPLALEIGQHWTMARSQQPVDETFSARVELRGVSLSLDLDLGMDLDDLYVLQVKDLVHLPCLLAPITSLRVVGSAFAVQAVNATFTHGPPTVVNNITSPLRESLLLLQAETAQSSLPAMLEYSTNSAFKHLVSVLNNFDAGRYLVETCSDTRSPLDTLVTRLLQRLWRANFTHLAEQAVGPQPPPLTAVQAQARVVVPGNARSWDMTRSIPLGLWTKFLASISNDEWDSFLRQFGTTGATWALQVSGDDVALSVGITELIPNGIALSRIADGLVVYPQSLIVTRINSLDFDSLKLFHPETPFVTDTHVAVVGPVYVELTLAVEVPAVFKNSSAGGGGVLRETFKLNMTVTDLDMSMRLVTAVSMSKLSTFQLSDFVTYVPNSLYVFMPNWANILGCAFGLFFPSYGLRVPQFQVKLGGEGFVPPVLDATPNVLLSRGVQSFVNAVMQILSDMFVRDFQDLSQGGLRTLLEDFVLIPLSARPGVCVRSAESTWTLAETLAGGPRYLNFLTSPIPRWVHNFTSHTLAGGNGDYSRMNAVLNSFFDASRVFMDEAALNLTGIRLNGAGFDGFEVYFTGANLGSVDVSLRDVRIQGIGTVTALDLLNPRTNQTARNVVKVTGPVEVRFALAYNFHGIFENEPAGGLTDDLLITVQVSNISVQATVDMLLDMQDLVHLPAASLSTLACLVAAVDRFRLPELAVDFSNLAARVECASRCTSPMFKELEAGGALQSQQDGSAELIRLVKLGVIWLRSSRLDQFVARKSASSAQDCALALDLTSVSEVLNPEVLTLYNVAAIQALAWLGVFAAFLALVPLGMVYHYKAKDVLTSYHVIHATQLFRGDPVKVDKFVAMCEREGLSLARHPSIPRWGKVMVVTVLLCNIMLLVVAFTVLLTFEIDAVLVLLGMRTRRVVYVPFTMASLLNMLFYSSPFAAFVSVILCVMSCVWPIAKNLLLLLIWFAPSTFLTHAWRRDVLDLLDVVGKFSFLELFLVIVVSAGLRLDVNAAAATLLSALPIPEDALILEINARCGFGSMLLCWIAGSSLFMNHVIVFLKDSSEKADRAFYTAQMAGQEDVYAKHHNFGVPETERVAVGDYVFSTSAPTSSGAVRDRFRPFVKHGVVALNAFAFVVLLVGMAVPLVDITITGVAGQLLRAYQVGADTRTFSIFSFGIVTPKNQDPGGAFLTFCLQALYILTVCAAPLLSLVLAVVLWLRPMRLEDAKTLLFVVRCVTFWSSIEVFVFLLVLFRFAGYSIMRFLVDVMTAGTCAAAGDLLSAFVPPEDAYCASIEFTFAWSSLFTIVGVVMQITATVVTLALCTLVARDRTDVGQGRFQVHAEMTWVQYYVLHVVLVHGARHLRPVPGNNETWMQWVRHLGWSALVSVGLVSGGKSLASSNSAGGGGPVFVPPSQWNAMLPAQRQQQHHHPAPVRAVGAGKWNPVNPMNPEPSREPSTDIPVPPRDLVKMKRAMEQHQQHHQVGAVLGTTLQSTNPVFQKEKEKGGFSIDV